MRGTNSRDLILKDVFVTKEDLLMPRGIFGILRRERQVGIDFSYNF